MCSNCFTVWDVKLWTHNRVFSNNSECSWHVCLSCMAYAFAVFKMFFFVFFSKHALKNNSFHLLFSVVLLHLLQSERWRFWTRSFSDWLRLKKNFHFSCHRFRQRERSWRNRHTVPTWVTLTSVDSFFVLIFKNNQSNNYFSTVRFYWHQLC